MDRHPRACWFAAIPGAQKAKDVEDCLKNTAARSLNRYLQRIGGQVCAAILRGQWPQASKYWTPGACLVRVTGGHIGWSGNYIALVPRMK